jgi:hypothetical protein
VRSNDRGDDLTVTGSERDAHGSEPIENHGADGASRDESRSTISAERAALVWYGVGTVLIAVYIGAAAGLSRSPVIGTLLPMLFSVIGGVGGLYLAKTDLEGSALARRTKRVGIFVALLAVSVMAGSIYGISVRTGSGLRSFVPSLGGQSVDTASTILPESDSAFVFPAGALELGALRLRLRALGFTAQEQKRILEAARYELFERVPDFELIAYLRRTADSALATSAYFTDLAARRHEGAITEDEVELLSSIQSRMTHLAEGLEEYAKYIAMGVSFNIMNLYGEVNQGIQYTHWMETTLKRKSDPPTPLYFGGAASNENIVRLRRELLDLNARTWSNRNLDWMTRDELTRRIDALITAGSLQSLTQEKPKVEPYFEAP